MQTNKVNYPRNDALTKIGLDKGQGSLIQFKEVQRGKEKRSQGSC